MSRGISNTNYIFFWVYYIDIPNKIFVLYLLEVYDCVTINYEEL